MWSHIGTLTLLLAEEPRSTAGLLLSYQYLCGTILVTTNSMVWDWRVSRAGPMPFNSSCCSLFFVSYCLGWYCGAVVFRLIWCQSLSPSLALPTFFNNNNNNWCNLTLLPHFVTSAHVCSSNNLGACLMLYTIHWKHACINCGIHYSARILVICPPLNLSPLLKCGAHHTIYLPLLNRTVSIVCRCQ